MNPELKESERLTFGDLTIYLYENSVRFYVKGSSKLFLNTITNLKTIDVEYFEKEGQAAIIIDSQDVWFKVGKGEFGKAVVVLQALLEMGQAKTYSQFNEFLVKLTKL